MKKVPEVVRRNEFVKWHLGCFFWRLGVVKHQLSSGSTFLFSFGELMFLLFKPFFGDSVFERFLHMPDFDAEREITF